MSKQINLRLPDDIYSELQEQANIEACTITAILINLVKQRYTRNPILQRIEKLEAAVHEMQSNAIQPKATGRKAPADRHPELEEIIERIKNGDS